MRIFLSAILVILPDTLIAAAALDGIWVLDGPGTESEILLTEEGERRLQGFIAAGGVVHRLDI